MVIDRTWFLVAVWVILLVVLVILARGMK